jgi:CRISPR-associated protein (TIGR03986 family)
MYHKCKDTENLCPACKIFGTVIEKGVKEGTESFAGNVSFSVCELKGDKLNLISGQILKILSLPKPTSCNFYLIDPDDPQKVRDYDGRAIERRGRGFSHNPRNIGRVELRGRKFYWHQPYDKTLKRYTTTEEELKRNKQKLGLTSSVELLLPPAEFTFTVAFDNLADSDLGLLLWSLELEKGMGHKLGMGKPLGLGSVEINIEKLEIIDRVKRYTEIFSPGIQDKTAERQNYIDKFKKKLEAENSSKKFDDILNISDLKKIMDLQKPPQDNVRYPGDFQWFAGHKNLPLPTIEETVNDKKQLRDCRS